MKQNNQTGFVQNPWIRAAAVLVLVISAGTAAVLGYLAYDEWSDRQQGMQFYEDVFEEKAQFMAAAPQETVPTDVPEVQAEATEAATAAATEAAAETDEVLELNQPRGETADLETVGSIEEETELPTEDLDAWCGDSRHNPAGTEKSAMDFSEIRKQYPDCVGWLELPALNLDVPVMQGDDNEFYLNHLPNGYTNAAGSVMLDASCSEVFHSDINYLHAHCMDNGTMFGNLTQFGQRSFCEQYPSFKLYTSAGDYEIEIIAACTIDGPQFGYPTELRNEEHMQSFLERIYANSQYHPEIEIRWGDRFVVLSTCAYSFEDARFIVVGIMR